MEDFIHPFLQPPPFGDFELWRRAGIPGVALGLSWTEYGGRVLIIETTRLNRSSQGSLVLTGHLGDVMKESASLAVDWLRSVAKQVRLNFGIQSRYSISSING